MLSAVISAVVVGAIVGALGRLVVRGKQDLSVLLTIGIGVVAALVGTFIARVLGVADTSGIDWIELAIQVALAAVAVSFVVGRGGRTR
jgi:uncharacterized membrane protein YeaQ/YmgE (transglycosylase-associated protein family)